MRPSKKMRWHTIRLWTKFDWKVVIGRAIVRAMPGWIEGGVIKYGNL